jgi:DnaJ-class molecular chaperone
MVETFSMGEAVMAEKGQQQHPGDEAPSGTPATGEDVCPDCRGSGRRDGRQCATCGGTGRVVEGIGGG